MKKDRMELNEFALKTFNTDKNNLTRIESNQWNLFIKWFNSNLESDRVSLFYRGTTKSEIKNRINPDYICGGNDNWMKYIFEWGEKSKSFLINSNYNNPLVESIEDLSEETFEFIFKKINSILTQNKNSRVIEFKKSNLGFYDYFIVTSNKDVFVSSITCLDNNKKVQIRNYYLKLIHSIFDFGIKNENSIFVSCSPDKERAIHFAKPCKHDDEIIIFYWLPKPLERFGLSISIISQMSHWIGTLELPLYFEEFYPEDKEFCVVGALFPGHIIGYIDGTSFIINPDILNEENDFTNERIEFGFQNMDRDSQRTEMLKKSLYWKQVTLWENDKFTDRKLID